MTIEIFVIFSFILLLLFLLISKWYNGPLTKLTCSMKDKIVVITGATRGIGFETAKDLLINGAKVIIGSRDIIQGNKALNCFEVNKNNCSFLELDLTNFESINKFVDKIKANYGKIDILINNAGSCFRNFILKDGIELTYLTNHIGHLILSCLLLDEFNQNGKIINVVTKKYKRITQNIFNDFISSSNYDFSYNKKGYDWMKTYILSKLAGVHLAQYLGEYCSTNNKNIKVVSLHPGYINNHFFREIEKHSIYWFLRDLFQTPFRWLLFKDNKMGAQTTLNCCYMDWNNLINGGYYIDCHYEKLKNIGLLNNAKNLIKFDEYIIEKNEIVKGDKRIMRIFK